MNYNELLRSYIKNSGMSLSEISNELKRKGFYTGKEYISKLQNGRIPPAGKKLNLALAEILNCEVERLEVLAYLDKLPQLLKSIPEYSSKHDFTIVCNKCGSFWSVQSEDVCISCNCGNFLVKSINKVL